MSCAQREVNKEHHIAQQIYWRGIKYAQISLKENAQMKSVIADGQWSPSVVV